MGNVATTGWSAPFRCWGVTSKSLPLPTGAIWHPARSMAKRPAAVVLYPGMSRIERSGT